MILAAAQTNPVQNDFNANLHDHVRYIERAAEAGASLIVFPEMSLTSYCRDTARQQAMTMDDPRLSPMQVLANDYDMLIMVGLPLLINDLLYIGTLMYAPGKRVSVYTKQYLHTGEELVFQSSFDYDPLYEWEGERICLSTCYDIENAKHPQAACQRGCSLYIANIYYSTASMHHAHDLLAGYAAQHGMNVLLSNYVGNPWQRTSGGMSAFWDTQGELVASLDGNTPGLLIVQQNNGHWQSDKLVLN